MLRRSNQLKMGRATFPIFQTLPKWQGEYKILTPYKILKSIANEIVDIGCNFKDPRFCASIANKIYENLRVSEKIKRPSIDFMEKIQTDINAGRRAMLIDWLEEGAEEYRLLPDTLYLEVNYLDRSGQRINTNPMSNLGQNEIQAHG